MQGGFTYDGIDIADLDLEYAPDNANTYVWNPTTWSNHEETFEGHDGAYFYGATAKPKDFTLRCFYEDKLITSGHLTKIFSLFRRGKSAKLVFKRRPWVWYIATVMNVDMKQMASKYNGIITITMRAYYPFGRSDYATIPENYEYANDMIANSGFIEGEEWDTQKDYAAEDSIIEQSTIMLYNPGTEYAPVAIEIAGDVGDGVLITNADTNQSVKFVALTKSITSDAHKWLLLDGLSGKALLTDGYNNSYGFLYHDNGVLTLKSGMPIVRNIAITGEAPGNTITSEDGVFTSSMIGQYIGYVLDGKLVCHKIVNVVSENEITVETALTEALDTTANIVTMNKIIVTPLGESMELTKLAFKYKPTFT